MSDALKTEVMAEKSQEGLIRGRELSGMDSADQYSIAPSDLENTRSESSTSDLRHQPILPSSQVGHASDSPAFFLASSLVEAMQRMPGTFPEHAPSSDNTQKPRSLCDDSDSDQDSDKSMQSEEVVESSLNNASTSANPEKVRPKKTRYCKRPDFGLESTGDKELTHFIESEDDRLMILEQELRQKICEIDEAHKSNTHLRQLLNEQLAEAQKELSGAQKELAEVQEKLKKKTIYAKSLDEYVDELETKVELLNQSQTSPPAEQAQTETSTDSATTSIPMQQTNNQEGFIPVGDAVYRWQDYMIKSLQQQRDNLIVVNQDLTERYNKAFRDAILFHRKLEDNKRAVRETMRLLHGPGSFLPKDMSEVKMDLDKIYAVCVDKGKDRTEYAEASKEQEHEGKEDIRQESQDSACGSDWSTVSAPEDSNGEDE